MRWWKYLPENTDELTRFQEQDQRVKWLLNLPSGQQVLVDPCIWNTVGLYLVPSLEQLLPTPAILLQQGPTCGLFAMKMVAPLLDVPKLLRQAQLLGFTYMGEMFSALDWATLARLNGIKADVIPIEHVPRYFKQTHGGVAVVPYDSELSGIGYRRGENAHWCVVWHTWGVGGELVALSTHSSAVLPAVERWLELEQSNRQLEWSTVRIDREWVHVLSAEGLRGQAVWIYP